MISANGETITKVVDALYEGDYHNDVMQTKPYESKKFIRKIVAETLNNYLKRNLIKA